MYKGYEIPSYQIIKKSENIELRQYEKTLVAEVEVEGNREEAAKEGFRTLARYIFGKNTAKEKVAMTSPVNQQELQEESQKISMTSPVNQVKQEGKKWLIQFGMPKTFTIETLPTPKDSRIHFKNIPGKKMAAITFAGSWSDQSFDQNQEKLEKFITENGFKTKGEAIIAYYDDPFTFPWNRRNEVIWEVE
jgi:effector-binding domain-containing protein